MSDSEGNPIETGAGMEGGMDPATGTSTADISDADAAMAANAGATPPAPPSPTNVNPDAGATAPPEDGMPPVDPSEAPLGVDPETGEPIMPQNASWWDKVKSMAPGGVKPREVFGATTGRDF